MDWLPFNPNEEITHEMTRMVPVSTIMQNLTKSVDVDVWDYEDDLITNILKEKTPDESFWALCDAIPKEGFNMPICIKTTDEYDGWTQGNGHHRLAAAILLTLDEIPVIFSTYYNEYMLSDSTEGRIDITFTESEWDSIDDWYHTLWS